MGKGCEDVRSHVLQREVKAPARVLFPLMDFFKEHAGMTPSASSHSRESGNPLEEGGLLPGRLLDQWSLLDLLCGHGDVCYSI